VTTAEALELYRPGQGGRRQERRGAGQALAAGHAEAASACATPASSAHPLGARRVRLLGVRGRHHPRSARAGTTARKTAAASSSTCSATGATCSTTCSARSRRLLPGRHAHPERWDEAGQALRLHRGRRRLRHLRAGGRRHRALQLVLVRARAPRRPADPAGGRHQGSAVAGLRECWVQPRRHAAPGLESGHRQPINFFDGWQKVPEQDATTTPSRCSGSCSCATWRRTSRSAGRCSKGPRACSSPSWASKAGFEWVVRTNLQGPYFLTQAVGEMDDRAEGKPTRVPGLHHQCLLHFRHRGLPVNGASTAFPRPGSAWRRSCGPCAWGV
jgi:hypothetical protein